MKKKIKEFYEFLMERQKETNKYWQYVWDEDFGRHIIMEQKGQADATSHILYHFSRKFSTELKEG